MSVSGGCRYLFSRRTAAKPTQNSRTHAYWLNIHYFIYLLVFLIHLLIIYGNMADMEPMKPTEPEPKHIQLGIRPETRRKLGRIAELKRWKLITAAEAAIEYYLDILERAEPQTPYKKD